VTVEPPQIGFTGKIWDAVSAETLAKELAAGAGAAPMADAAVAWGKLAAGLVSASAEYQAILDMLGQAWMSGNRDDALDKLRAMQDWLTDIADAAVGNAGKAEHQAAAYQIAKLAMPDVQDISETQATATHLIHGAALGAPLVGAIAQVEHQIDGARKQAARVMQTYEAATAPLAHPWQQPAPPVVSSEHALLAERAAGQPTGRPAAVPAASSAGSVQQAQAATPAVKQTAFAAEQLAQGPAVTGNAPAVAPVPLHGSAADALLAPPAANGAVQPLEEDHVVNVVAALDQSEIDRLWSNAGFATAPAVLGGVAPAPTAQQIAPIAQASEAAAANREA
jgi:PPE-repeat protein